MRPKPLCANVGPDLVLNLLIKTVYISTVEHILYCIMLMLSLSCVMLQDKAGIFLKFNLQYLSVRPTQCFPSHYKKKQPAGSATTSINYITDGKCFKQGIFLPNKTTKLSCLGLGNNFV